MKRLTCCWSGDTNDLTVVFKHANLLYFSERLYPKLLYCSFQFLILFYYRLFIGDSTLSSRQTFRTSTIRSSLCAPAPSFQGQSGPSLLRFLVYDILAAVCSPHANEIIILPNI